MNEHVTLTVPVGLRDDFVREYGYEAAVAGIGGERMGTRDAFTAVEFAAPKGQGSVTVRLHPLLPPVLRQMFEVRWADHFDRMTDLEAPYARALKQLKTLTAKKTR